MRKSAVSAFLKPLRLGGFLMLGGLMALGCTQTSTGQQEEGSFQIAENEQFLFKGVSKPDTLTHEEWATYKADRQYVVSRAPDNVPVVLNHADARQHRFVMMRLKMAGKTPQNSPQLFKLVNSKRSEHQAKGYKEGEFITTQSTTARANKHYFNSLNVRPAIQQMEVVATASVKDELFYGYVDSASWDANGTPLGDMAYTEIYGNMPYHSAATSGDLLKTSLSEYTGDSLLIEDTVQYGYRETFVAARNRRPTSVTFGAPAVNAPLNVVGSATDTCPVSVCLNRTWTNDCDYDLTGYGALRLPLKGSIPITSTNGIFDETKINEYKQGIATDSVGTLDHGGGIRVVLTNVGGGCDVDANNSIALGMRSFWDRVTLSADKKTLTWDMTGDKAATFDPSCRQVQDQLELSMNIKLPYLDGTTKGIHNIHLTNLPTAAANTKVFPCIKVTNSCLAAGTMIAMSDGTATPIEAIKSGDQVFNPHDKRDSALEVSDTAKGVELEPMVRIQDEKGRSLLMTRMHPMPVVDRGMVLAKYLKVGDKVMTEEGPSKLAKVSYEAYDGAVYNLKVGSGQELARLGEDQTVVYANGFLVGDGQIQSKYESKELMAKSQPHRLPVRWKKDFIYSARR